MHLCLEIPFHHDDRCRRFSISYTAAHPHGRLVRNGMDCRRCFSVTPDVLRGILFPESTSNHSKDPSIIVSPADGKVVKIDRVGNVTKVSIFLSLFNVHVNRSPIAGNIEALDYRKGKFKAAYNHAASVENERNTIMVSNGRINLVFTQIAGVVARRIVFWKRIGDRVEKGDLVGLIRFGSRVDILFPAGTEVTVAVGDRVRGGSSPIGVIVKKMAERRGKRRTHKNRPNPRSERLQSGLSLIPSLFTIGNIFCGYFSVISTFKGNYDYAAMAIGVGVVLDSLDGRIARMTKTSSEFGVQLDSLADVLTFGIAPAVLAFIWGQNHIAGLRVLPPYCRTAVRHRNLRYRAPAALELDRHIRLYGLRRLRLARFNVQSQNPLDTGGKRNFVGLPIPAGAGLIAAIVHFFKSPIVDVIPAMFWYLLVLLTAY